MSKSGHTNRVCCSKRQHYIDLLSSRLQMKACGSLCEYWWEKSDVCIMELLALFLCQMVAAHSSVGLLRHNLMGKWPRRSSECVLATRHSHVPDCPTKITHWPMTWPSLPGQPLSSWPPPSLFLSFSVFSILDSVLKGAWVIACRTLKCSADQMWSTPCSVL